MAAIGLAAAVTVPAMLAGVAWLRAEDAPKPAAAG